MLEESWDSQSYEVPKKSSSKKSSTTASNKSGKLTSLDAKFPPTTPLKNVKRTSSNDSIDALFSPTNSASDSGTPAGKKNTSFTFDDSVAGTPAKDTHDYLSNFAANSTELEDSILGELLGGPKKALKPPSGGHSASTKSTRAQHRLEPLESEEKKASLSTSSSLKNAPSLSRSKGKPSVDLDRSADFGESTDRLFDDDKLPASPPTQQAPPLQQQQSKSFSDMSSMGGVLHTNSSLPDPFKKINSSKHMRYNSFDDNVGESLASIAASANNKEPPLRASLEQQQGGGRAGGAKGVTYADELAKKPSKPSAAPTAAAEEGTDEVDLGGFMPSFLEPNRQGRRRRSLETSPMKSSDAGGGGGPNSLGSAAGPGTGGGYYSNPPTFGTARSSVTSQLDELDVALGLSKASNVSSGAASKGSNISDLNTSSGAGSVKKPVDPFSAAEAKAAAATRASSEYSNVNFDSSSDDDDYRLKRNNKPTFGLLNNKNISSASAAAGNKKTTDPLPPATAAAPTPSAAAVAAPTAAHRPSITETTAPASSSSVSYSAAPPAALNVPAALERESSLRPNLSRSPTGHSGASSFSSNNNSNSSLPVPPQGGGGSSGAPNSHHSSSHVSTLPSLTVSTASSVASLAPLDLSVQDEDLDELDVSGIVRPSEAVTPSSGGKSPHLRGSSRPSSAGHKTSTTPRRYSDGNSSLNNSVNLDDSTSSISPHHSRGGGGGGIKKSQSLKLGETTASASTSAAATSSSGGSGAASSSVLSNARGMLQRAQTIDISGTALEINTQLNAGQPVTPLVVDRDAKDKLKHMQRVLDQTQQEKESSERTMRMEIEALKSRLATSSSTTASAANNAVGSSVSSTSGYKHFIHEEAAANASARALYDEINEQKRTISALELEICRLKDEANIKAVKQHDELRHLKDRYESETSDLRLRHHIDLESIERRHGESITAVKKIHEDEILMYKEKSRSSEVFTQLAASMKNTTGSIKYIEEQLYAKYRQVELQREGQIEARERLLSEMEEKARERVDLAEAEGYKLKGILSHMEAVVSNLRSQGGEEKERLRQEHSRLAAMQAAVEQEKAAVQSRNIEELHYVKQRSKEVEIELNKLASEKQSHYEYVTSSQHKLDVERAEFNQAMAAAKRTNEARASDLQDAEVKLRRREEELDRERSSFEARRGGAMKDLQQVEEMKRALSGEREQLGREREQLHLLAGQVQRASEGLEQREEELAAHEAALEDREGALVEGFHHMKAAAGQLTSREKEIRESLEVMDAKKISLDRMDREVLDRKIAVTSAQREYLRGSLQQQQGQGSSSAGGILPGRGGSYLRLLSSSVSNTDNFNQQQQHQQVPSSATTAAKGGGGGSGGNTWLESFHQQMKHSYAAGLSSASGGAAGGGGGGGGARSPLPKEIRVAQQTLQQSRSALSRVSANQMNIQRSIQDENDFIHLLKKNQANNNNSGNTTADARYAAL